MKRQRSKRSIWKNIERTGTVAVGTNDLLDVDRKPVKPALEELFNTKSEKGEFPEKMGWENKKKDYKRISFPVKRVNFSL
jgi:hypothetical protein